MWYLYLYYLSIHIFIGYLYLNIDIFILKYRYFYIFILKYTCFLKRMFVTIYVHTYARVLQFLFFNLYTVGTRNKEKVGQHRIIPYCESFPSCESQLLAHVKISQQRKVYYYDSLWVFILLRSLLLWVPTELAIRQELVRTESFLIVSPFFIAVPTIYTCEYQRTETNVLLWVFRLFLDSLQVPSGLFPLTTIGHKIILLPFHSYSCNKSLKNLNSLWIQLWCFYLFNTHWKEGNHFGSHD